MGEYLDRRLTDSLRDTVRQRTFERYESLVRVHIKLAFMHVKLKDLTSNHGVRRQDEEHLQGKRPEEQPATALPPMAEGGRPVYALWHLSAGVIGTGEREPPGQPRRRTHGRSSPELGRRRWA